MRCTAGVSKTRWERGGGCNVPDLDELTARLQERQIACHGHLGAGDGVDDEINGLLVVLDPVGIIIGSDVLISTESEDLVLLRRLPRDTDDLISAKSLRKQHTEVSQTTHTDNANRLPRPSTVVLQRREHSDTTAQHRRGILGRETLGDGNHPVPVRAVVVGVTAVRLALVTRID